MSMTMPPRIRGRTSCLSLLTVTVSNKFTSNLPQAGRSSVRKPYLNICLKSAYFAEISVRGEKSPKRHEYYDISHPLITGCANLALVTYLSFSN